MTMSEPPDRRAWLLPSWRVARPMSVVRISSPTSSAAPAARAVVDPPRTRLAPATSPARLGAGACRRWPGPRPTRLTTRAAAMVAMVQPGAGRNLGVARTRRGISRSGANAGGSMAGTVRSARGAGVVRSANGSWPIRRSRSEAANNGSGHSARDRSARIRRPAAASSSSRTDRPVVSSGSNGTRLDGLESLGRSRAHEASCRPRPVRSSPGRSGRIGRLLADGASQRGQRPMELDGERGPGATQDAADLVQVQVIVEAQYEHAAVRLGQAAQRSGELIAVEHRRELVERRLIPREDGPVASAGRVASVGIGLEGGLAKPQQPPAVADVIDDGIGRDAVEPATKRLVPELAPADGRQGSLEGRGGQILGHASLSDASDDETEQARQVEVVELAEGGSVQARAVHEVPFPRGIL